MVLWRFIWDQRTNRKYAILACILSITLWSLLKFLYPYPTLVLDSYYYVKAAALNLPVNAWPVGYSKFLQIFNLFSHAGNVLVTLQYILLQASCLLFFFTWLFLFRPGKWISNIFFVFLFVNPLFLYCSNFILSDALFITLSLLWVTQLLWIVYHPRPYMILTHALLLVVAFTVRYNALYYPVVSTVAFLLIRQTPGFRLAGIALPAIILAAFILYTADKTAAVTGERQFSAFGGWKVANDALYMYAHVYKDQPRPVPEKFRILDSMVRQYFIAYKDSGDILKSDYTSGSFFMFAQETPLVRYMFSLSGGRSRWPFIGSRDWLSVGPLYQAYGEWLIGQYPAAFARYFLWPNFLRYINPPGEIFGSKMPFIFVEDYGGAYVRQCIGLDRYDFTPFAISLSQGILSLFPKVVAAIHLGFVIGLLGFLAFGGFRHTEKPYSYCLIAITTLWCCDVFFSVLSAGVVLRYEIFVLIMEMAFGLYFMEYTFRILDRPAPLARSRNAKFPAG